MGENRPVNRYCHQNISRDEVSEDAEEHEDLAADPVRPPRHCRSPGDLERDSNQDDLSSA